MAEEEDCCCPDDVDCCDWVWEPPDVDDAWLLLEPDCWDAEVVLEACEFVPD